MEIKIAVCDDDIKDLEKLHALMSGYGEENHLLKAMMMQSEYLSEHCRQSMASNPGNESDFWGSNRS